MMESNTVSRRAVAVPIHTMGLLVIMAAWAWLGVLAVARRRAHGGPPLIVSYSVAVVLEWLILAYVLWGVRRHGGSLRDLVGGAWARGKDVWRDVLIAAGFWIVSVACLAVVGLALHVGRPAEAARLLAPHGALQIFFWMILSSTAGFCEETIFRGYVQRQFIAMSGSAPMGILLSAVAFGGGHLYQGGRRSIVIGVFGAMFGILAYVRRSLRPGMMTHAWHDGIAGLLIRFAPK
jgi:membrane protease YdiL (CAAX protease family)